LFRSVWIKWLTLLSLVIVTACSNDVQFSQSPTTVPQATPTTPISPSPTPSPAITPKSGLSAETGSTKLSDVLTELTLCQKDEMGSDCFVSLKGDEVQGLASQYSLHRKGMYLFISFKNVGEQENQRLTDTFRVDGAHTDGAHSTLTFETGEVRYQLTVPEPSQAFTVQLGDLKPIAFAHQEPLKFRVETQDAGEPVLLLRGQEYGTRLMISDQTTKAVFVFNEPMLTDAAHTPKKGRWVDERQIVVEIIDYDETKPISLPVLSKSGNYPPMWQNTIFVYKTSDRSWIDAETGQRAGWSPRDLFYDNLIFSPDEQRYIGIVELGGAMGDGNGTSFSYILEEKGSEPVIIEDLFYSTNDQEGVPIQWMDNHRLLYASYYGTYVFDIKTKSRKEVYSIAENGQGVLNFAGYDPFAKQLNILVITGEDKVDSNEYSVARLIYKDGFDEPEVIENFATTTLENKYHVASLEAIATPRGMYWTMWKEGRFYTVFEGRDGSVKQTEGRPILYTADGLYLARDGDAYATGWARRALWKPDGTVITLPNQEGFTRRFGSRIAVIQDDSIMYYSTETKKWKRLSYSENDAWIPNSPGRMIYRIKNS
jgi:hypothetical protein